MKITEFIKQNTLFLDGGMGTLLQKQGLGAGELPEMWNLSHPDVIVSIHRDYFAAGSHVCCTNTFGANCLKMDESTLERTVQAAICHARTAQKSIKREEPTWVALDIGPTGRLLKPYGDLSFDEAVAIFAKTVRLGQKYGADLILIETMSDSYETKAALLAAKENASLPVFVSNAYGKDGKLMTGADASAMIAMLEGLGADAIGVNCSLGPNALSPIVADYLKYASLPIIVKPNAGLPTEKDGQTLYDISEDDFAKTVSDFVKMGVRAVGGCCGTTPSYIAALKKACEGIAPLPLTEKPFTCISSYTHALFFGERTVRIGERINPTGKPQFKDALRRNDIDYLVKEGIKQEEEGVDALDVNVGLPEIDEPKLLSDTVCALQAVCDLPLQIDTADAVAMERALRLYNGKPMLNSVSGKKESMDTIFPLAKKYGGLVVALTLDEDGIPQSAEGRVAIAKKILKEAKKHGIAKKNLIFDPLAMTISADTFAARETLRALKLIREKLGCHTSLGVSNVSFGLPMRDGLNATFFAMAMQNGLSCAIMNPHAYEMKRAFYAYTALAGLDENCASYIAFTAENQPEMSFSPVKASGKSALTDSKTALQKAIVKGLGADAARETEQLLATVPPLHIIENEIIPALDIVGRGFESKTLYLPQLLMSAEAAKASFEVIKERMPEKAGHEKCAVVLATVKGDIHDIGKNIVKLLLENYGFRVYDLGRDVLPEDIVAKALAVSAPLVALSALMTTTVPAMEKTIRLLKEKVPFCRTVVGGAVLTQEYADKIGADFYAKDAMAAVRFAETVNQAVK